MPTLNTPLHPTELDPAIDVPIPPVLGQSENVVFFGVDPDKELAFWCHLGRLAPDGSIWEGIFALYLPDDRVLSHRSVGRSVLTPATAELRSEPVQPLLQWAIRLDGVAQRVEKADAGAREVSLCHSPESSTVRQPYEPLGVDILFTGTSPVFDTGVSGQGWGNLHIHQLGRYAGTVKYGGQTQTVDFHGGRDHTRGPRDYTSMAGEWWATCTFPSGRTLDLLQTWRTDGFLWSSGAVNDGTRVHPVSEMDRVPLTDTLGGPTDFDVTFRIGPTPVTVSGTALDGFPYTLIRPTGFLPGQRAVDPGTLLGVEGPARFEWDGEVGYGWIERCRPLRELSTSTRSVRAPGWKKATSV
jgi:hypothetical protein